MTMSDESLRARDIMSADVQTVTPDATLSEVVSILLHHRLSNVPVARNTESGKTLVGFVSEGDCLEHLSNELFYGCPSPAQTAATMMQKHPVCAAPDLDLFSLSSIMVHHRLRHLPVVDGDRLLGIVSRRDVLAGLDTHYRQATQRNEKRRFPPDLHQIVNHRFVVEQYRDP